jgi:pyruvate formate lyase activating enzyme
MDLCKYLDAANIDLKSFDEHAYAKLTGGSLKPVLETLKILKSQGVWLEITTLLIPGLTDDMKVVREMCDWLVYNGFEDVPLHFSRFYPCHQLTSLPSTLPGTLESAREIAMDAGIHYVYIGNLSGTTWENTYCPVCKRMVVERDRYAVRSYSLHDGVCHSCRTAIAGVWA